MHKVSETKMLKIGVGSKRIHLLGVRKTQKARRIWISGRRQKKKVVGVGQGFKTKGGDHWTHLRTRDECRFLRKREHKTINRDRGKKKT